MKKIFLLFMFAANGLWAQTKSNEEITEYFDKDWKTIIDPAAASYYRTVERTVNALLVRDYFISGKIQMEALCSSVKPKLVHEGKRTLYYENGTVREEVVFKDDIRVGIYRSFYENGRLEKVIDYDQEKPRYLHYFSETSEDLLPDGKGFIKERFADRQRTNYTEIENSVAIASFYVTDQPIDTVYFMVEKLPEYKDGVEKMMRDIGGALKYPKSARRAGIEGVVYVQFIVGKKGDVKEGKVIRGIDPECDQEALQAVTQLHRWNPGLHKNKAVQVTFVLPVRFKFK